VKCLFATVKRLYFTTQKVEDLCEKALNSVKFMPDNPEAIRFDRFLERKVWYLA